MSFSFGDPVYVESLLLKCVYSSSPYNCAMHCRYDIMREDKVGSVNRSERGFLEFAAATFFEVNNPF